MTPFFTPKQKDQLLELLDIRLNTIMDDPTSADAFETEQSLQILDRKIRRNESMVSTEIDWILGEADNREDIPEMKAIIKQLRVSRPIISKTTVTITERKREVENVWSKDGHDQMFQYADGGRAAAGYKGYTGDCVARAVCIASGLPYQQVYDTLAAGNATQKKTKRGSKRTGQRTAGHGINVKRKWFQDYMRSIGFEWKPTMFIGQGCKVHLRSDELPKGNLVITVSGHYTAMIDGILMDTYDCSREGTRCVYGFFYKK